MTGRKELSQERFGIIGVGEVGLRLSMALTEAGYNVVGVDIDQERIERLRQNESYIRDISDTAIERLNRSGFVPTTSYEKLESARYVAICVPTPLGKSGQPDISYVADAVEALAGILPERSTVIIESTVYPGATENLISGIFEEYGYEVGADVYVAFSPERVDPGNDEYDLDEIPKVVGGVTDECCKQVARVYRGVFDEVVRTDSATEAEMVKILENTFRNVNIALVNELVKVADNFDIDFWNVIEAAKTKPYGFMPFYPGPGLGGHCIPVDPLYLTWRAKQEGIDTPLVDLADRTNRDMSEYVVRRVTDLLNENGIPVPEADVLILGVTYKPDVPDVRNSPAIDIIKLFDERGADVSYHDPAIPELAVSEELELESQRLTSERLTEHDCVVIVTDHSAFDVEYIVRNANLLFDTRNATTEYDREHVERL